MKTAKVTAAIKNGENPKLRFSFSFSPAEDSASVKAWEEENAEYASWNLIVDHQDPASC